MKICIDLGTARTAIAIKDQSGSWLNLPTQQLRDKTAGGENLALETLIKGLQGVEIQQQPISHLIVLSRYCKLGEIVVPFCLDGSYVSVPSGVELFPTGRQDKFENIKETGALVTPFLTAVTRLCSALAGEGAEWIVGRSAAGLDLGRLGLPPGSRSYNEAVAVVFTLVSLNVGMVRTTEPRPFLLVADLGGGFLDVSVADAIQFTEDRATAAIINYGGYPVGVDRIDPSQRFSKSKIVNADHLIQLVTIVVLYHLWDYITKAKATKPNGTLTGLIVLTGGGFKRIPNTAKDQLKVAIERFAREVLKEPTLKIQIRIPEQDTKYLTLAGLGRMEDEDVSGSSDEDNIDRDISLRSPSFHGTEVLQWAKVQPKVAESWSALLDQERHDRYGR